MYQYTGKQGTHYFYNQQGSVYPLYLQYTRKQDYALYLQNSGKQGYPLYLQSDTLSHETEACKMNTGLLSKTLKHTFSNSSYKVKIVTYIGIIYIYMSSHMVVFG